MKGMLQVRLINSLDDPGLVLGNVFGVEELAGRRVLAELVVGHAAAVHEGLPDD